MDRNTRTPEQQRVVDDLKSQFDIDTEGILFLNREKPLEPWLPYDVLETIARQSGKFQAIEEHCINIIGVGARVEVVHSATVTDPEGRTYTRSGVARLGEQLENEDTPNEHNLAASRALNAALRAAGFSPLKAGSVVLDLRLPPREHAAADQEASRLEDTKIIHAIAREKGLVKDASEEGGRKDMSGYRALVEELFGTTTSVGLSPAERAILINTLRELPDPAKPREPEAQVA